MQAQQLYGALNAVKKESMIRVEADEVTYPLHIILRYAAVQSSSVCNAAQSARRHPWQSGEKATIEYVCSSVQGPVPADSKACAGDEPSHRPQDVLCPMGDGNMSFGFTDHAVVVMMCGLGTGMS